MTLNSFVLIFLISTLHSTTLRNLSHFSNYFSGQTLLHHYAKSNVEITKYLLEKLKFDPNIKSFDKSAFVWKKIPSFTHFFMSGASAQYRHSSFGHPSLDIHNPDDGGVSPLFMVRVV